MHRGRRSSSRTPTGHRAGSTGRVWQWSGRSGASSTGGGPTIPSRAATSTSFWRRGRTPSSTTTMPAPGSPSVRSGGALPVADEVSEARVGRVKVEDARAPATGVPEPVAYATWRREEFARLCHDGLVVVHELDRSVEDEERVDMVVVRVRRDLERGVELDLDERQLREGEPDGDDAVVALEPLAAARAGDHRVTARRLLRRMLVVLARVGLLTRVHPPQIVGEPARGCVDVEESHRPRPEVVEPVHDTGRYRDGVARLERQRVARRQDLELAFEDDERVDVRPVEVPIGTGCSAGAQESEDGDVFEVCEHLGAAGTPLHDLDHDAIL